MLISRMQVGEFELLVESASFRYVTDRRFRPGWDFSIRGRCREEDEACDELFFDGALLRTEVAPLPFSPSEDLTGTQFFIELPYDAESGEPLFGLYIMEELGVSNLKLHFLERDGTRYLIEIKAEVAHFGPQPTPLHVIAWVEQLPDGAY